MFSIKNIYFLLQHQLKSVNIIIWFYISSIGIITLFLSITTPPLRGIDEPYHFFRAIQISKGQLLATKYEDNVYGGNINKKLADYGVYTANNKTINQDILNHLNNIPEEDTIKTIFSPSATYSPIMYIPLSTGLFISRQLGLSVTQRYLAGKICNIISCLILLLLIVIILPYGKYFALLFLSTPSILQMTAYYNADPFTNLLAMLFIACCTRIQTVEQDNSNLWKYSILILALSLGCLKITYCFFSLLILLTPIKLFKNKIHYILFCILTIGISIIPALTWNMLYKFTPGASFHMQNNPAESLSMIQHHPLFVLKLLIHSFRFYALMWTNDIYNRFVDYKQLFIISGYSKYIFTFLLLLTFFTEKKYKSTYGNIFKFTLSISYCIIVAIAFYIGYSPTNASYIDGIQIRYYILPILLIGLSVMSFLPSSFYSTKLITPIVIINLLCILYVMIQAVPKIIS